jgi:hypothetical protein
MLDDQLNSFGMVDVVLAQLDQLLSHDRLDLGFHLEEIFQAGHLGFVSLRTTFHISDIER